MAIAGKTKQDVVSEFRCAEILAAARKVFADNGFRDTSVDRIAEAAGLAKGTLYLYFASKKDIYLAALQSGLRELVDLTRQNMDAACDPKSQIEAFVRTRLEYGETHRDFFRIYHAEFGNLTHPAYWNEELRELYHAQLGLLESRLRSAMAAGGLRTVPVESAATTLYEATRGLLLRRMLGWSSTTVDEDVAALSDLMWRGIGQ